ncbi:MAG: DUF1385 domain-containing protein [Oscillospiraceae bacterium]|nr:DUF1385 domain-containing protein [Oscillospiraceae bacterium]
MSKSQSATECTFRTRIGGQALIEGILMRGVTKQAIVVRAPDGSLVVKEEELSLIKEKYPVLGLPLIRGAVTFIASMVNGVKALMFSAEYYPDDPDAAQQEPSKFDQWLEKHFSDEKLMSLIVTLSVIFGVGLSIVLFFLLPTLLGTAVTFFTDNLLVRNLAEALLRAVIFMAYMILCSKTKDMKRVFAYHGAEHKSIFCYERGLPLTVDNVREMPRFHPRCGTSFMVVVIIVSIIVSSIVFSVFQVRNMFLRMLAHLILLPIIVGVTYEINTWCGRVDNKLTRAIAAPGLWMQNFTTNEPDDSMMEVAIKALELVIPEEKGSDEW